MNKAKEILEKHTKSNGCKIILQENPFLEQAVLNAIKEAINYSRCCKSDSELFYCYLETDKKCEKQCSYCLHIAGNGTGL